MIHCGDRCHWIGQNRHNISKQAVIKNDLYEYLKVSVLDDSF